jgi:hypothetical protein
MTTEINKKIFDPGSFSDFVDTGDKHKVAKYGLKNRKSRVTLPEY